MVACMENIRKTKERKKNEIVAYAFTNAGSQ